MESHQNQITIEKPIFIVGSPRSGTTLLYEIVSQHKDLASISQFDLRDMFNPEYLQFVNYRRRIFDMRNWKYMPNSISPRFYASFEVPFEAGQLWDLAIKKRWATEKDVTSESKEKIHKFVLQVLEKKGKTRFLNKTPQNSVRIRYLNKIFHKTKFIHIVRDGRAVIASMIRRSRNLPNGYFGIPLEKGDQMKYDIIERHARQWLSIIEEIKKSEKILEKDQIFSIRYEDFCSNPRKKLEEIFNFCEIEYDDVFEKKPLRIQGGIPQKISSNLKPRNELWKEEFSEDEKIRLEKMILPTLKEFEYS